MSHYKSLSGSMKRKKKLERESTEKKMKDSLLLYLNKENQECQTHSVASNNDSIFLEEELNKSKR